MKQIMEEYGGAILAFMCVLALIGIVVFLLSTDGPVQDAFAKLIKDFMDRASGVIGGGGS